MRGPRVTEEVDLLVEPAATTRAPHHRRGRHGRRGDSPARWAAAGGVLVVLGVLMAPAPPLARTLSDVAAPPDLQVGQLLAVLGPADDAGGLAVVSRAGTVVAWHLSRPDQRGDELNNVLTAVDRLGPGRGWRCGPAPDAASWVECVTDDGGERIRLVADPAIAP